jgi:hypothetical protein
MFEQQKKHEVGITLLFHYTCEYTYIYVYTHTHTHTHTHIYAHTAFL